jgi:general stress protein YciG
MQMANQGNQSDNSGNQPRNDKSDEGDNKRGTEDQSERGFAAMDKDEQREIARKGGESVPDEKRSFSRDPELASEAGKKGAESRRSSRDGDRSPGTGAPQRVRLPFRPDLKEFG